MTSFSTATTIFAVAMTVIAFISLPAVEAQASTSCVSKLVPCFGALNTTTKPSKDCCDSIKEAVEKELSCLCNIYNTPGLLSQFNVNASQALNLSRRCDVDTDLSSCSGNFNFSTDLWLYKISCFEVGMDLLVPMKNLDFLMLSFLDFLDVEFLFEFWLKFDKSW